MEIIKYKYKYLHSYQGIKVCDRQEIGLASWLVKVAYIIIYALFHVAAKDATATHPLQPHMKETEAKEELGE